MSDYSPIADHSETAHNFDHSNNGKHSSLSRPYNNAQAGSSSRFQQEAQVIQVTPAPQSAEYSYGGEPTAGPSTFNSQDGGQRISRYETSLALRYDIEASLAYVLGIFSGAVLLILEKKNDYVRFHAWQSSLLSAVSIVALVIGALISDSLYWLIILAVVSSHVYMARRAYFDGAVFERFTLPYVGAVAIQLVDEE
ncbi:hypothetical protein LPJ66_006033 [Kickxella alabastrina]|uniref:Uncharacterized protein n=1 Tax=Kickxella alabastrina TaxID=61397 RepID=A0ACC1IL82_9FUNG|nr:hypothetical protein LPJ66_006033 [Kickxella alabastrina]